MVLLFAAHARGQEEFAGVDAYVAQQTTRTTNVDRLAGELTQNFSAERDKVRAIFYWVATNVAYDVKRYRSRPNSKTFFYRTNAELIRKRQRRLDKRNKRTLRTRSGICQDYADLFTALCTSVGISCQTVSGTVKKSSYQIGRLGASHAWNMVRIGDKDFLVDPTWASGYVDKRVTKFNFRFNDDYFFVDPEKLIYTHYPRQIHHQLLPLPIDRDTYCQLPILDSYFLSSSVCDLSTNEDLLTDSLVCVQLGVSPTEEPIRVMLKD